MYKQKRNNKGKFTKKRTSLYILLPLIAVIGLSMYFASDDMQYIAPEVVAQQIVVDDRDDIQKLADNYAEAFRSFQEANEAHVKTTLKLEEATIRYNESVEYLQTYTK